MISPLYFTIPGRVSGKGRPKFSSAGKFVRVYTPAKTRNMEAVVREIASQAMLGRPIMDGPVKLEVTVFQRPAESWSKKRKAEARWVTGKPDCDNVLKLVGDSLNNIVWNDDAQIACLAMERRYSMIDAERVEVGVFSLT